MSLKLNLLAAPTWAQDWSRALEVILTDLGIVKHDIVATVAKLPLATRWPGRSIIVRDVGAGVKALCFSDGTNWIRADTGATV